MPNSRPLGLFASVSPSEQNSRQSAGSSLNWHSSQVATGNRPGGRPASRRISQSFPRIRKGPSIPAFTMFNHLVSGSNTAYWIAVCLPGIPRKSSRSLRRHRTWLGDRPVLCTPRIVPATSAAYNAAGSPFARHVADANPDLAVWQRQIVQIVSPTRPCTAGIRARSSHFRCGTAAPAASRFGSPASSRSCSRCFRRQTVPPACRCRHGTAF